MNAGGAAWARGFGVALVRGPDASDPAIAAALADGVERGFAGPLPPLPAWPGGAQDGIECYAITARREHVGVIAWTREADGARAVVHAVAIVAEARGHAFGARALRCAERRLEAEGAREFYARVPRTNGHGLYFMLRCGYAPLLRPLRADGATWFRRAPAARGRAGGGAPSSGS